MDNQYAKTSYKKVFLGCYMKAAYALLLLICLMSLHSATAQPNGKVEQYSTEDGLSHQRITGVLEDKEGFLWLASWNGINRFDGQRFVSFKSAPGDRFQLGNDRIVQVVDDGGIDLWVLAYDNQVYRFHKPTERFFPIASLPFFKNKKLSFSRILSASPSRVWLQTTGHGVISLYQASATSDYIVTAYQKEANAGYQLPGNAVSFFREDREHHVWIGTTEGLCHLQPTSSGADYTTVPVQLPGMISKLNFTVVEEDAAALYFGTREGLLVVYSKRSKTFSTLTIEGGAVNALLRSGRIPMLYATSTSGKITQVNLADNRQKIFTYPSADSLGTLYEDKTGAVWIEPEHLGIIRLQPTDGTFRYLPPKTAGGFNSLGNRFRVFEDASGLLWLNIKGGGFGYYNAAANSVSYTIRTPDKGTYALPDNVYSIYYDSSGVLWLTTYERELIKISLQESRFRLLRQVEESRFQADNEVRGVLIDKSGRLWAGTKAGELYVYRDGLPISGLFNNGLPDVVGNIYAMLQDKRGIIWIATKGSGLYKAEPINPEQSRYHLTRFSPGSNQKDSLPSKEIYSLLQDRQGRIWLGTYDKGLLLLTDRQKGIAFLSAEAVFKSYPRDSYTRIRHMELDEKGNLWLATTDGLLVVNPDDAFRATTTHYAAYSKIPGNTESLGNNDVQFVYRDGKKRMWLGTSGGGFCQAIGNAPFQSLHFVNYTTREGMPNDYVLSCADDRQGNIWIATENGLTRFNLESKIFRNYDSYDGLPKTAFSESVVDKNAVTGQLFFGTTNGVLFFSPADIGSKKITARIAFTNLRIDNEEAGPVLSKVLLEKNIDYLPELKLNYNQNIISIDYAILDHGLGGQKAAAYRLLGFDTTWQDDRQQHRATYTNLPSGSYVLEVRSGSNDLYVNQPYRRLPITILPPPWRTWWAYLLYFFAAAAILYYIRRNTLSIIRLRNKVALEQKLAALKLDFFTNVSHELRTPLTLIINPLDDVAKKEQLSPVGASNIDIARRNADRMKRFINQLLDLRKVQSNKAVLRVSRVELVSFVKRITDYFTGAAKSKHIMLTVEAENPEIVGWLDADKMDVVLYNLLGNALKFTPEGKSIVVGIRHIEVDNSISIAVCDEGPGVPKGELEKIFDLFHEGEQGEFQASKGTGIGLTLSREMVQLHGGNIKAANNKEGGLTVTVQLKADASYYRQRSAIFVETDTVTNIYGPRPEPVTTLTEESATLTENSDAALVLLVEDNEELRFFIHRQLSDYYRVEVARDGQEGLEKAIALLPELVVSDIMMPNMDGIQMLDNLKNDERTSHIPVILLSAKYSVESRIEGLKYGADNYITKPFDTDVLIASVDNLLRQRKKLFQSMLKRQELPVPEREVTPEASIPKTPASETITPIITVRDTQFLQDVIRIVEEKMIHPDFNIELIADSMAMSRTAFYKKFRSLTGQAPVEFVKDWRLQLAKTHLDKGTGNVSEIAYEVGFSNPRYFSTCFREKFGISPSEYIRKQNS